MLLLLILSLPILAKSTEVVEVYKKVEGICHFFSKWIVLLFVCGNINTCFILSVVHSIFCIWHGNYDTSTWFTAVKFAVPFDTNIILNWYLLLMFCQVIMLTIATIVSTIISYFVSCCFYINACCKHFRLVCRQIEEKISGDPKKMNKNRIATINEKFNEAAFLHIEIIESVIISFYLSIQLGVHICFLLFV